MRTLADNKKEVERAELHRTIWAIAEENAELAREDLIKVKGFFILPWQHLFQIQI